MTGPNVEHIHLCMYGYVGLYDYGSNKESQSAPCSH